MHCTLHALYFVDEGKNAPLEEIFVDTGY